MFVVYYLFACLSINKLTREVVEQFGRNLVSRFGMGLEMNLLDLGIGPNLNLYQFFFKFKKYVRLDIFDIFQPVIIPTQIKNHFVTIFLNWRRHFLTFPVNLHHTCESHQFSQIVQLGSLYRQCNFICILDQRSIFKIR